MEVETHTLPYANETASGLSPALGPPGGMGWCWGVGSFQTEGASIQLRLIRVAVWQESA